MNETSHHESSPLETIRPCCMGSTQVFKVNLGLQCVQKTRREPGETLPPRCYMGQQAGSRKMSSSLSQSSRVLHRRAAYYSAMISFGKFRLLHVGTICYWTNNVSSQQHANTPLVAICWHVSQRQRSQCSYQSSAMQQNTVHSASSYAGAWFAGILWPVWVRSSAVHCTVLVFVFVFAFLFVSLFVLSFSCQCERVRCSAVHCTVLERPV